MDPYAAFRQTESHAPPSDKQAARLLLMSLRADPPGQSTDNRWVQSQKFTGIPYVAIRAICQWMSGSTVKVLQKRPKPLKKAVTSATAAHDDSRWTPADDDCPAADLFEHVNSVDTWPDFISQWTIQEELTGNCYVWTPPNQFDRPAEMWVLPTALMQYVPVSPYYPRGAWRFQPYYGISMPYGGGAGAVIPAEEVLHYRCPHPLIRWDGYSTLTAMAKELDAYDAITTSRASSFARGVKPDLAVRIKNGSTNTEAQRVQDQITATHGGPQNAGKTLTFDGDDMDVEMLNRSPREMDYGSSWDQAAKACSAGFGVNSAITGLTDAESYASFWAQVKQFFSNKLAPGARSKAEFLTKHLIRPHYGKAYRAQIDLPKIDDEEMKDRQLQQDGTMGVRTVNEIRAARDLDPWEGGDVPPAVFAAQLQQKIAPPEPPPMAPGQVQAEAPPVPAAGVGAKGPTPPRNAGGRGSLPPRQKSMRRAARRYAESVLESL